MNLYQYAFAFSNIQGSFLIYTMSLCAAVPCSELVLGNGKFGHVFAVEEDKNEINPAVVSTSESNNINVESNDAESNMQTMESNVALIGSNDTESVYLSHLGSYFACVDVCINLWMSLFRPSSPPTHLI